MLFRALANCCCLDSMLLFDYTSWPTIERIYLFDIKRERVRVCVLRTFRRYDNLASLFCIICEIGCVACIRALSGLKMCPFVVFWCWCYPISVCSHRIPRTNHVRLCIHDEDILLVFSKHRVVLMLRSLQLLFHQALITDIPHILHIHKEPTTDTPVD